MNIFSIFMLITAVSFLYFIFRSINKNIFLFGNAIVWIAIGIVLVIFSLFGNIPAWLSEILGFQLTSNFLLFLAVIFLLVITFMQSLQLSKLENQLHIIIQELSIAKVEKNTKKVEKENE
ncbi:DUF2304 domain-containing protein [Enterococcus sp. AZ109]|uniref:DUF2304 domain-containing protein n=1 Tax=Enterococcus sp. AZ109 TaxID=2774634 RepID=UPI003F22CB24